MKATWFANMQQYVKVGGVLPSGIVQQLLEINFNMSAIYKKWSLGTTAEEAPVVWN